MLVKETIDRNPFMACRFREKAFCTATYISAYSDNLNRPASTTINDTTLVELAQVVCLGRG